MTDPTPQDYEKARALRGVECTCVHLRSAADPCLEWCMIERVARALAEERAAGFEEGVKAAADEWLECVRSDPMGHLCVEDVEERLRALQPTEACPECGWRAHHAEACSRALQPTERAAETEEDGDE